jgi:hypothetical protein
MGKPMFARLMSSTIIVRYNTWPERIWPISWPRMYSSSSSSMSATEKLERIGAWAADGVGRLWKRFPLFAILLGWFGAGGGFGVLTWAFGGGPEVRKLLGFWAMGLVAIVMLGFLRSLRSRT